MDEQRRWVLSSFHVENLIKTLNNSKGEDEHIIFCMERNMEDVQKKHLPRKKEHVFPTSALEDSWPVEKMVPLFLNGEH